jgi:ankyrin repeat protein
MSKSKFGKSPVKMRSSLRRTHNATEEDVIDYIDEGGDIDAVYYDNGNTLLTRAVAWGDLDVVEILVESGADLDKGAPLQIAIENHDFDIANYLIESGADLTKRNYLIDNIILDLDYDTVKFIIELGVDVNEEYHGKNALHFLVEKSANIQEMNNFYKDLLFRVASLLVRSGINVNMQDDEGKTPINTAVFHGNMGMIVFLIENGADLNIQDEDGFTPINNAVRAYILLGTFEIFKYLIQFKDVDVNLPDNRGETPLHIASDRGDLEIIDELLKRGDINVNVQDEMGDTPLHRAVDNNKPEIIEKLLNRDDIDLNIQNNQGETPLHLAVKHGEFRNVIKLVDNYADHTLEDINGDRPIDIAIKYNDRIIIMLLDSLSKMKDARRDYFK